MATDNTRSLATEVARHFLTGQDRAGANLSPRPAHRRPYQALDYVEPWEMGIPVSPLRTRRTPPSPVSDAPRRSQDAADTVGIQSGQRSTSMSRSYAGEYGLRGDPVRCSTRPS